MQINILVIFGTKIKFGWNVIFFYYAIFCKILTVHVTKFHQWQFKLLKILNIPGYKLWYLFLCERFKHGQWLWHVNKIDFTAPFFHIISSFPCVLLSYLFNMYLCSISIALFKISINYKGVTSRLLCIYLDDYSPFTFISAGCERIMNLVEFGLAKIWVKKL